MRRVESPIAGAHGTTLFRRVWSAREPVASLLIVHGLGEHSGRYDAMGEWFAARGFAVHAYDQHGHGKSDGISGHVRKFSEFLDDLESMLSFVRSDAPELPIVIVGHSLGGLVVAAFACEREPEVAGVVTSGAALALAGDVSPTARFAVRALAPLLPRLRFDAELDPAGLSHDLEVVAAYRADPLVFPKITLSLASEIFGAIRRTAASAARVRVPMLMLHGEADPICPASASRRFFDQLEVADRRLEIYPGLLHEIFNESDNERVFGDLLDWARERTSRG